METANANSCTITSGGQRRILRCVKQKGSEQRTPEDRRSRRATLPKGVEGFRVLFGFKRVLVEAPGRVDPGAFYIFFVYVFCIPASLNKMGLKDLKIFLLIRGSCGEIKTLFSFGFLIVF